jgi:hypothetical protein
MSTRIDIASSSSSGSTPIGAKPIKTNVTTSYFTGDDGGTQRGRATDFFTLGTNNPYGNTTRFLDELGGTSFANSIAIDWSTYDNIAGTVLGYYYGDLTTTRNLADSITWANSLTVGTFSGWRLWNAAEAMNTTNYSQSFWWNYAPFNFTTNQRIWTSTPIIISAGGNFYAYYPNGRQISQSTIANNHCAVAVRYFTVTGTTLT